MLLKVDKNLTYVTVKNIVLKRQLKQFCILFPFHVLDKFLVILTAFVCFLQMALFLMSV